MMDYYLDVLKKYAVFEGRASRKEYWMFLLFSVVIAMALGIIDSVLFRSRINVLGGLYHLAILIPSLALLVRRLHDTNRSAWWLLLYLLPIIGWVWIFVLTVLSGTPGENRYGQNPKGFGN